ncbi:PRD domain-containing protein [Fictibacillus sp. Mic-4]|uniref:glucose PTS transporter transcription antiterminator GlcT n=1 Tax=Fictibacillus TaxID=1329200 RepID=UPI0004799F11|nr:PRD domain-containing protein [Fictibacillus gelatini]
MNGSFQVKKVLNNNVVIAGNMQYSELIMIGKGIGFGKKKGDTISEEMVDKLYVLSTQKEKEQYLNLIHSIDDKVLDAINEVITLIETRLQTKLYKHIHIALTDHIAFAIKRIEQGMDIKNPFLAETKTIYPTEYKIAKEVIDMIWQKIGIRLPEGEIGFIALHIHSAITNKNISDINHRSRLVNRLIQVIEDSLQVEIDYESINFLRLVRHLRYAIERIEQGDDYTEKQEKLAKLLKEEYPICYNLAWKLMKIMQNELNKPVSNAEAVYLTLHLQRLSPQ